MSTASIDQGMPRPGAGVATEADWALGLGHPSGAGNTSALG